MCIRDSEHTDHARGGEIHDQFRDRKPPAHNRAGVAEWDLRSTPTEPQRPDQGDECDPAEDRRPCDPQDPESFLSRSE